MVTLICPTRSAPRRRDEDVEVRDSALGGVLQAAMFLTQQVQFGVCAAVADIRRSALEPVQRAFKAGQRRRETGHLIHAEKSRNQQFGAGT